MGNTMEPSIHRFEPVGPPARLMETKTRAGVMHTQGRLWFDCDPGTLAVLMIGICSIAVLALSI